MFTYEFNGATRIPYSVPHPHPQDRLDKSMSPRVGDFAQKIIPHLIIPGGTLKVTLDRAIARQKSTVLSGTHGLYYIIEMFGYVFAVVTII